MPVALGRYYNYLRAGPIRSITYDAGILETLRRDRRPKAGSGTGRLPTGLRCSVSCRSRSLAVDYGNLWP